MKKSFLKIVLISLLLLIVVGTIFLVNIPDLHAAAIDGIMAALKQSGNVLLSIYEKFGWVYWIGIISFILSIISMLLLNWAAGIGMYMGPGSLGYVFIDVGYTWVLGMVNMFFVIAFVFAALLYILDVEWGIVDKKTLPRLIIVALLINFSLLFVQLIVDFFIIFERGVKTFLLPLGLAATLRAFGAQIAANYTMFILIPYLLKTTMTQIIKKINAFTAGTWAIIHAGLIITGAVAILTPLIMEIISNTLLLIVFSLYTALFIARSAVIYLFAMLAPLAIAATIFPATRKYFDEWLKQLVLWGIMGTIIFFILAFGFQMHDLIMRGIWGFELIEWVGFRLTLPFVANFFFAIYSIISFFMIKKYLPSAAQGAIGMLQKGAMLAGGVAAVTLGGAALAKYGPGIEQAIGKTAKGLGIKEESVLGGIVGDFRGSIRSGVKAQRDKMASQFATTDLSQEDRDRIARETKDKEIKKAVYEAGVTMGDEMDDERAKEVFGCVRKNSEGKMIDEKGNEVTDIKNAAVDRKKLEELAGGPKKLKTEYEHMTHLAEVDNCKDMKEYKRLMYKTSLGMALGTDEKETLSYLEKNLNTKDKDNAVKLSAADLNKKLEDTYDKIMRSASDSVIKKAVKGLPKIEQEIMRQRAFKDGNPYKIRAACLDDTDLIRESCQKAALGSFTGTAITNLGNRDAIIKLIQSNLTEDSCRILSGESGGMVSFSLINKVREGTAKPAEINRLMAELATYRP